ncbi:DNA internalization-related competence protein ComEC/Rec2 [Metabacillus litoralis]|uniref:DNA internalization-related competence protein ComEC/Rec2 n=1 Tax=Metabacillus litoralis TaxID=152268 RepID=UPI0023D8FC43|nr:DNA internalization-related competence protein ComEC/Rec2 [Metabacillus litoralis]
MNKRCLLIKGNLLFYAIAASLAILVSRFDFHPLAIISTCFYLVFFLVKNRLPLFVYCLLTIITYLGVFHVTEISNKTSLQGGEYTSIGEIITIPTIDGNFLTGTIQNPQGEKLVFSYVLKTQNEKHLYKKLESGNSCTFKGELQIPKSPTMPNAFNYKQYLYDHHIHWKYQVKEIENCYSTNRGVMNTLVNLRKSGLNLVERNFSKTSVGIVQALIFGERHLLQEDIEQAYQELGIVHLLAISGLHVGLLVGGIYFLLIFFGITHEKSKIIMIIFLPIYMVLTGGAPSVLRASMMVIIYFVLQLLKQKVPPLDVISFTYLCLLFINPYYLFQIGFQLSFVVSFGLLLSSRILQYFTSWILKLTTVSLIAQICGIPLLLSNFYEFSLISLPMNMIFVPFYSFIILPLAIVATFTLSIPFIGPLFVYLITSLLELSHQLVLFASTIPLTITTGKPSLIFLFFCIVLLLLLFIRYEKTKKGKTLILPTMLLLLLFVCQALGQKMNSVGQVLTVDVGQGDSIFIQQPFNGGTFLIDTGGKVSFPKEEWEKSNRSYSIVKSVTVPYLKSIGVTKLNGLFLTHGDFDHIGEVLTLMDEIKIEQIIIPIGFERGELEENIINKAFEKGINIKEVKSGDQLNYKDLSFHVVSPNKLTESKNNDSLVLWAKIGGLKWVFTGDAEINSEELMIKSYPSLKADVMKVGHHGSKGSTSEKFLDAIDPSYAIVSAGYNNRYQHPHKEVVDKLFKRNINILRTDLDGAVLYRYKGNSGTFLTHPPYDEVK